MVAVVICKIGEADRGQISEGLFVMPTKDGEHWEKGFKQELKGRDLGMEASEWPRWAMMQIYKNWSGDREDELEVFRIYSLNLLIYWMWGENAKMIIWFLFNLIPSQTWVMVLWTEIERIPEKSRFDGMVMVERKKPRAQF